MTIMDEPHLWMWESWKGRIIVIQREPMTDGTEVLRGINWIVTRVKRIRCDFDIVAMCGRN